MISVVIPAHQEEAYLERTLATLRAAGAREVIVVANGCSDGTARVARAGGACTIETPSSRNSPACSPPTRPTPGMRR